MKLSFAGVSKLRHDYHEWLNGSITAGYEHFQRDLITYGTVLSLGVSREGRVEQRLSDTLLLKTHADEYRWAEPDAYSEFVPLPEIWSVLIAPQFRTWTRNWRLELRRRKLTAVLRATFS